MSYCGPINGGGGGAIDAFLRRGISTGGSQEGVVTRKPVLLDSVTSGGVYHLRVVGSLLFAVKANAVQVYRIDEYGKKLTLAGELPLGAAGMSQGVRASTYDHQAIYLPAISTNKVFKINFTDPANLWLEKTFELEVGDSVRGIERVNDYIYVTTVSTYKRLAVFNKSTGQNTKTITTPDHGNIISIKRYGKFLIGISTSYPQKFFFWDVSVPALPYEFHRAPTSLNTVQRILVIDNYLEVMDNGKISFFDLTDIATFDATANFLGDIADAKLNNQQDFLGLGNYSVILDWNAGNVWFLDHRDKGNISFVDSPLSLGTPTSLRSISAYGTIAYIADTVAGEIQIVDINGYILPSLTVNNLNVLGETVIGANLHVKDKIVNEGGISGQIDTDGLLTTKSKGSGSQENIITLSPRLLDSIALSSIFHIRVIGSLMFAISINKITAYRLDGYGLPVYAGELAITAADAVRDSAYDHEAIYLPCLSSQRIIKVNYSDPANMTIDYEFTDTLGGDDSVRAIERAGNYIYASLVGTDRRIIIIDKDTGLYVNKVESVGFVTSIKNHSNFLICASTSPTSSLFFLNIGFSPTTPTTQQFLMPNYPTMQRIRVFDNCLEVMANGKQGLFDLSNITGFDETTSFLGGITDTRLDNAQDFQNLGSYSIYLNWSAGDIILIDHRDKANPEIIEPSLELGTGNSLRSIDASGSRAFVADNITGHIRVLDLHGYVFPAVTADNIHALGRSRFSDAVDIKGNLLVQSGIEASTITSFRSASNRIEAVERLSVASNKVPANIVYVESYEDFPEVATPGAGRVLENYTIYQGKTAGIAITIPDAEDLILSEYTYIRDMRIFTGGQIRGTNALKLRNLEIAYTGTGYGLQVDNSTGVTLLEIIGFYSPTGRFINIPTGINESVVTFFKVFGRQCTELGVIDVGTTGDPRGVIDFLSCQFYNYTAPFEISNTNLISMTSVNPSTPLTVPFAAFSGTIDHIMLTGVRPNIPTNGSAIFVDPAGTYKNVTITGCPSIYEDETSSFFSPGSLTQKDPIVTLSSSVPVPDSAVGGEAYTLTTIPNPYIFPDVGQAWRTINSTSLAVWNFNNLERMEDDGSGRLKYTGLNNAPMKVNGFIKIVTNAAVAQDFSLSIISLPPEDFYAYTLAGGSSFFLADTLFSIGDAIVFYDTMTTVDPGVLTEGFILYITYVLGGSPPYEYAVSYTPGGPDVVFTTPTAQSTYGRVVKFHGLPQTKRIGNQDDIINASGELVAKKDTKIFMAIKRFSTAPSVTLKDTYYSI